MLKLFAVGVSCVTSSGILWYGAYTLQEDSTSAEAFVLAAALKQYPVKNGFYDHKVSVVQEVSVVQVPDSIIVELALNILEQTGL